MNYLFAFLSLFAIISFQVSDKLAGNVSAKQTDLINILYTLHTDIKTSGSLALALIIPLTCSRHASSLKYDIS